MSDARALASPDLEVVIVGNKSDRPDEDRQVPFLEASRWAQDHGEFSSLLFFQFVSQTDLELKFLIPLGALFVEASSKTGENVEQVSSDR